MAKTSAETVAELKAKLADLPPGATKIKVDGLEAEMSIDDAIKHINYFEKQAAQETGKRPKISSIDLSSMN